MASTRSGESQLIMRQVLTGSQMDTNSDQTAVLSCGGIYIPHRGRQQQFLYHIINTSSAIEPVKVVTGAKPKNVLHEILIRESMN